MPPYARKNRAPQAPTERILSQLAEEAEEQIRRLLAGAPQAGSLRPSSLRSPLLLRPRVAHDDSLRRSLRGLRSREPESLHTHTHKKAQGLQALRKDMAALRKDVAALGLRAP